MKPYVGSLARVDLSSRKWSLDKSTNLTHRSPGGRAVKSWLLFHELVSGVDPLSPENMLEFCDGALVGTTASAACCASIGSKNLLTGGINYAFAGEYPAVAMKQVGFDNPIVSDRADHSVYLFLHDGKIESRDVIHLWGKTTWVSQVEICEELSVHTLRLLTMSLAGENCMHVH